MVTAEQTEVAVLGTLAEFHQEPIPYDLPALVELVGQIHPDLLCLDMTSEQWQQQAFDDLPPEYSMALLPLAGQTDIVVVPIAGERPPARPVAAGWRGWAIGQLRRLIAAVQRSAPGPTAVNQGWRHDLANVLYTLTRRLAGREVALAWQRHTEQLTTATLEAARRDPGRRLLVVVNVQHCHHIRHRLRHYAEIVVTTYTEL